ncbi:MAG TPA: GNAT family N-acetyltransferase [Ignavibacteriaceae bacterium]|nr:GNAT family N-acetyltransferase [Ignavibacteriaceae bacterium]
MDDSKITRETEQDILRITEQLFAGKAALDKEEHKLLLKSIESKINETYTADSFSNNVFLIESFEEIFNSLFPSQIAPDLMRNIPPEVFYEFGNYLLKNLTNSEKHPGGHLCGLAHSYLNVFRLTEFLQRIYGQKEWESLILDLIIKSNFNVNSLFSQRVKDYSDKTLFSVLSGRVETEFTWNEILERTKIYAKSILKLFKDINAENESAAFLMENELSMAVLDLACLTNGILNIMIPANSVPQHLVYILNQTKAPLIFVSDEKQLYKIRMIKNELKYLKKIILRHGTSGENLVITFDNFIKLGETEPDKILEERLSENKIENLASIMYTSGTTGDPKGIMFSQVNIVYKRFCRALAIPKIGDKDKFLAYLPLYHTFGRWFEMVGSIFWGATYVFMENPSIETMITNMQTVKPSIFISIPKKWVQLYDYVSSKVDIEIEEEEIIQEKVYEVTGGKLKWGLSAAGYLSPDIFQFFQKYKVELMSGFGMTEATGGITMTPPGNYIPDSLGKALPGIKIKLAEDGEILIRGPYVMMGYFGEKEEDTFLPGHWLPTGDIMQMDENEFIKIIDRKKEIYKNIKGETIAPQKIENYFRDFDTVKQVFLAGDHRPFNTVLIYPNFEDENAILKKMDKNEMQEYFSSAIVTVNKFLAPYERIVDFRIIDRPFSDEKGELTPKGTYKRRIIEKNFTDEIETMYVKDHTSINISEIEVRIPNWFLREKGCLSRDIIPKQNGISIPKLQLTLAVECIVKSDKLFRIGDFNYKIKPAFIDLQQIFITPLYWIGNKGLFEFTGESIFQWFRQNKGDDKIIFDSRSTVFIPDKELKDQVQKLYALNDQTLYGFHLAVLLIESEETDDGYIGLQYLKTLLDDESQPHYFTALTVLQRPGLTGSLNIRRELFKIGIAKFRGNAFADFLELYLKHNFDLLDNSIINLIVDKSRGDENLKAIELVLKHEIEFGTIYNKINDTPIPALFALLSQYGIQHPNCYKRIRQIFMYYKLFKEWEELVEYADKARLDMLQGFRKWLGSNPSVAVDVETGEEYRWSDVIIMEEGINKSDKQLLIKAISETSLIREAIFLFSDGTLVGLNNILPGGLWISHLGSQHEKSVYRITIQTRFQGAFDIVINLNKDLPEENVREEINWLVLAGSEIAGQKLVEDFGGYWEDYDLWTEEFVPGETVAKFLQRESRKKDESNQKRLFYLWPYFVWSAATSYMNFWKLSGYKLELADPMPTNIIIPTHDYQTGTRLVSISERTKSNSPQTFFYNFFKYFIQTTEEDYPFLKKLSIWNYVFSGVIDSEGEYQGLELLSKFRTEIEKASIFKYKEDIIEKIDSFINNVSENGFIPKKLFFAIKRFHRWFELNKDAALTAQAEMIYELYETYQMYQLEENYPETRARFFLETIFINSSEKIKNELKEIIKKQHEHQITKEETLTLLSGIQSEFKLTEREDFFLTRLSYPHLKPTDSATLMKIKSEGTTTANLVVQIEDNDGKIILIRNPVSPKEISRLHQLYIETNLLVHFRPEHQFLVALSERGYIIGGLFYLKTSEQTAHMEKIVVSNRYRRKGISEALMNELFSRLRDDHIKHVTTGFFRPEYFYRFGFKIERKYSGLVKDLSVTKQEQQQELI